MKFRNTGTSNTDNPLRVALGWGFLWFVNGVAMMGLSLTDGASLNLFFSSPAGWLALATGAALGLPVGIFKYRSINNKKLALQTFKKAQEPLINETEFQRALTVHANDVEFRESQTNDLLSLQDIWLLINTLDNVSERCKLQKNLLKILNDIPYSDNANELTDISDAEPDLTNAISLLLDPNAIQNNPPVAVLLPSNYPAILTNYNQLTKSESNSTRRSAFGAFFGWFIAMFSAGGFTLIALQNGGLDLTSGLSIMTSPIGVGLLSAAVLTGSIAAKLKYTSKRKLHLAIRNRNSIFQLQINQYEYNRLTQNPYSPEVQKQIENGWELSLLIQHPGLRVKIQKDILRILLHLKNTGDVHEFQITLAPIIQFMENFQASPANAYQREVSNKIPKKNKLTREELRSALRSSAGMALIWLVNAISLAGLSFSSFSMFGSLFFTPVGWGLLSAGLLVAGISGKLKFDSKRKLKFRERESDTQQELLFNEEEYQRLLDIFHEKNVLGEEEAQYLIHRWKAINHVGNPDHRTLLQKRLLNLYTYANSQDEKLDNDIQEAQQPQPSPGVTESPRLFSDYLQITAQWDKLSKKEFWSVFRSALSASLNWSFTTFCVGGFTLLNLTSDLSGFAALAQLFTNPISWSLSGFSFLMGALVAASIFESKTQHKLNERNEALHRRLAFNALEYHRVCENLGNTYLHINLRDEIWQQFALIKHSGLRAQLQEDFIHLLLRNSNMEDPIYSEIKHYLQVSFSSHNAELELKEELVAEPLPVSTTVIINQTLNQVPISDTSLNVEPADYVVIEIPEEENVKPASMQTSTLSVAALLGKFRTTLGHYLPSIVSTPREEEPLLPKNRPNVTIS